MATYNTSTMEEVLARCQAVYRDVSGQDLLFSRDFTKDEFASRRRTLADRIGTDSHALIHGAPPQPSHLASQDATFYYFTGIDVVQSFMLVAGKDGHSTLFLPSRDEMDGEPWDKLGFEEADMVRDRLGFDEVKPVADLEAALGGVKSLYFPFAELEGGGVTRFLANGYAGKRERDQWDGAEPRHKSIIRKLGERFPDMTVTDAGEIVGRMRRIKSDAEVEVLRQGAYLSALIMIESMKATRPGLCESRLEAIAKYIYSAYGNCDLGYGVIAASGDSGTSGGEH